MIENSFQQQAGMTIKIKNWKLEEVKGKNELTALLAHALLCFLSFYWSINWRSFKKRLLIVLKRKRCEMDRSFMQFFWNISGCRINFNSITILHTHILCLLLFHPFYCICFVYITITTWYTFHVSLLEHTSIIITIIIFKLCWLKTIPVTLVHNSSIQ